MIPPFSEQPGQPSPWHVYLDREHTARDQYLAVTARAHKAYLIGPWPDRDAYQALERSAWLTYYQAGRDAWRTYRDDIERAAAPPQPFINRYPYLPISEESRISQSGPYDQAKFTPHPETES